MRAADKGKTCPNWFALYPRDQEKFETVRTFIEERDGRPASTTKVVIHLLERLDDLLIIDEAIKAEAKKVNRLHRRKNGSKHGNNGT